MSQRRGCGSGGERLSELSIVYEVGAGLAGLCVWQTGLKVGVDLEVGRPARPLHWLSLSPLDEFWLLPEAQQSLENGRLGECCWT